MRFISLFALVACASAIQLDIMEEPKKIPETKSTDPDPAAKEGTTASGSNKFAKCKYFKEDENSGCKLEDDQLPCTKARTDSNFVFKVVKNGDKIECQW